jgi:hypothetical protein
MVEVGLVKFATVALRVGQRVLPSSRRTCSKPRLTPPRLWAMIGLMHDEHGTFREAEVRLAEAASGAGC